MFLEIYKYVLWSVCELTKWCLSEAFGFLTKGRSPIHRKNAFLHFPQQGKFGLAFVVKIILKLVLTVIDL